jgi:serine/threonine protein kinase
MNLASNLVGKTVNGWFVEEKISKDGGTGGVFSSGYVVRDKNGQRAFMKAINIGYAVKMWTGVSRTDLINQITADFKYERDILNFCGKSKMDRIVRAIDSGEYDEPSDPYFVPYLVFEFSEEGDIRRHKRMIDPDLIWRLRIFHGICVGVKQLHSHHIAHQDLKPSNVLVFSSDVSKIADLGRCTLKGSKVDDPAHCGDLDYTPIELQAWQAGQALLTQSLPSLGGVSSCVTLRRNKPPFQARGGGSCWRCRLLGHRKRACYGVRPTRPDLR